MPNSGQGRGRPRSDAADSAILAAVVELISEGGLANVTFEGVAGRAGVARTTIYRRWRTKTDLVRAMIEQFAGAESWAELADAGDLRTELLDLMTRYVRALTRPPLGPIVPTLIAEGSRDPHLARVVRADITKRRRVVKQILARAKTRGDVRSDIDDDLVIDALVGTVLYRLVITARPVTKRTIEAAVDQVMQGIANGSQTIRR